MLEMVSADSAEGIVVVVPDIMEGDSNTEKPTVGIL
jgi:hypothetical protein